MDKGYYDYDYSDPYDEQKERLKALKPKSNAELQAKLSRMGFGCIMAKDEEETQEEVIHSETPEDLQRLAMESENRNGKKLKK